MQIAQGEHSGRAQADLVSETGGRVSSALRPPDDCSRTKSEVAWKAKWRTEECDLKTKRILAEDSNQKKKLNLLQVALSGGLEVLISKTS